MHFQTTETAKDAAIQFMTVDEFHAQPLHFQPSGALRWVERENCFVSGIVSCDYKYLALQQEWVNPYTGARRWEDVPTEEEEAE